MEHDLVYLAEHVKQQLAVDERTHLLDVAVWAVNGSLFVTGTVACAERREAAEEVVRDFVDSSTPIVNALCVERYPEPQTEESFD
jgi:hypothetical protein